MNRYKDVFFITLLISFLFQVGKAQATLYPINTQFAEMKNGWYSTVDFEFSHDDQRFIERNPISRSTGFIDSDIRKETTIHNIPAIDIRKTFKDKYRIGINTSIQRAKIGHNSLIADLGDPDGGARFGIKSSDRSAFGFSNVGLTLERKVRNNLNIFINQIFPTTANEIIGQDAYSLEAGISFQKPFNTKYGQLSFFQNIAYAYTNPRDIHDRKPGIRGIVRGRFSSDPSNYNSLISNSALVLETGTWFNPLLEFLVRLQDGNNDVAIKTSSDPGEPRTQTFIRNRDNGISIFTIVPGFITPISDTKQLRVGFPIGLNHDSPDWGVQLGMFFGPY